MDPVLYLEIFTLHFFFLPCFSLCVVTYKRKKYAQGALKSVQTDLERVMKGQAQVLKKDVVLANTESLGFL